MKPNHFLASVLFTILSIALFAQVKPQHFQQEKIFLNRHLQIPDANHDFNSFPISNIEPVDEFHNHYTNQNTFLPEGEFWKNGRNTDEAWYFCDSTFSYESKGTIVKTIHTRDAAGRELVRLSQSGYSEYPIWFNIEKHSFTYYDSENMFSCLYQKRANDYDWLNYSLSFNTYDDSGNILVTIEQMWLTGIKDWVNTVKVSHQYDASGNRLSEHRQRWDSGIADWVNFKIYLYTYDDSGNQLSILYQVWDTGNGDWLPEHKYSNTYDDSGNLQSKFYQQWNNEISDWVNIYLSSYTYDDSENMLSNLDKRWNSEIGDWVNNYLSSYTYEASGNCLLIFYHNWESEIGDWVNTNLISYTYDDSGNILSEIMQKWDNGIDNWVNWYNYSYTFDASGNRLKKMFQLWSSETEDWINKWKANYDYDYNANKITGIFYYWSNEEWVSDIGGFEFSIFNNYLFFIDYVYKAEVYYSSLYVGIDGESIQPKGNPSFCSPNPAKNVVNVTNLFEKEASLKIYNMNGQQVNEKLLTEGQNQVSLQNLSPGIYLFVVQSENSRVQNKVVVY